MSPQPLAAILQQQSTLLAQRASGVPMAKAALVAGVSRATAYRRTTATAEDLAAPRNKGGRPRKYSLTTEERAALVMFYLKRQSLDLAAEDLMASPVCQDATRRLIQDAKAAALEKRRPVSYPPSLRQAAFASEEFQAIFRGPKAFQKHTPSVRRSMERETADGLVPLLANDKYESDDVSINSPYSYYDAETDQLAHARQVLLTLCAPTLNVRLIQAVGRRADSYTAIDIMDHLAAVIHEFGLPLRWTMERGRWKNQAVDGLPLRALAKRYPGWADRYRDERWGGVGTLFHLERAYSSNGKAFVEGFFNFFHSLIDHHDDAVTIGRVRGEFEAAAKVLRQANDGNLKALGKMWTMREATDHMAAMAVDYARRQKLRFAYGKKTVSPEELDEELAQAKRELPQAHAWRLLPIKKAVRVIDGVVTFNVPPYPRPFSYLVNGAEGFDGFLNTNHVVLVAMHPDRASNGLWVFNGDMGNNNYQGYEFGQQICVAPQIPSVVPQWSELEEPEAQGGPVRNKAVKRVRQEFAIIKTAGSKRWAVAKDGQGGTVGVGEPERPEAAAVRSVVPATERETVSEERAGAHTKERDMAGLLEALADW